jgi:hypothetical protein
MHMSRRSKILIGAGIVLGLVILIPVVHHYQLRFAVEKYVAELKAQGEPMELAQVIPPPVPPKQNFTALFTNAVVLLDTNENVLWTNSPPMAHGVAPGKAMIGWAQPYICELGNSGPTNSWADIDAALVKEKAALELLSQLSADSLFDFNLNYQDGFADLKLSPLAKGKKAALRLAATAMDSLHRGDMEAATTNILAMQSIVHGFTHDRLLISELVRIAIAQIAVNITWEFLQSTNATDAQLAALQRGWTNLEFIRPFENSMTIERAGGQIELSKLRKTGLETYFNSLNELGLFGTRESGWDHLNIKFKNLMWRYWWSYPDQLRDLRGIQATLQATRQFQTNYSFVVSDAALKKQIEALSVKRDDDLGLWFTDPAKADFHFILSSSLFSFERAFDKMMKVETARQLAATAIALKRYQLKNGNYPADLNSLVPEFLPAVPRDPVDGQPLRYRPNADGTFLLYSIGQNGKDDGGNPALKQDAESSNYGWQNPDALDWVWPQLATAEEIQKYYAQQANSR